METGKVLDLSADHIEEKLETSQLCGFKIGNGFYAIPVLHVQEVVRPQQLTHVPLSDKFIRGLINLRGQIVTSVSIRSLFKMDDDLNRDHMNIIVRSGESLTALVVDEICDVITVDSKSYEPTPDTISPHIEKYIKGVYKLEKELLIVLNLEIILGSESKESN